jgi:hypothetical protein
MDVTAFQRGRLGPDGAALVVDGQLGPRTRWAMALAELPQWRQDVVLAALQWVGLQETGGENRGPEIDAWLAACGVQPGNPWCAAFVSAILRGAGIACAEARAARLLAQYPATECPVPGDLGGWVNDDGTGHVGIVTGVSSNSVSLCEGNSGDGVRVGVRSRVLEFRCPKGSPLPAVAVGNALGSRTR